MVSRRPLLMGGCGWNWEFSDAVRRGSMGEWEEDGQDGLERSWMEP